MSFSVTVLERQFESCDKCKADPTEEAPMLSLDQRDRDGHNVIYLHERCLMKAIEKAKKGK